MDLSFLNLKPSVYIFIKKRGTLPEPDLKLNGSKVKVVK